MKKIKETLFTKPIYILFFSLVCTILWGSAYPCIKTGYKLFELEGNDVSGKLLFAGIRFFTAGILILIFLYIKGRKVCLPDRSNIRGILLISMIQTVLEYLFFYISMSYTTGIKGSVLNSSSAFFTIILAHIFFKNDKITLRKLLGCIIGFIGIIIINLNNTGVAELSFNFMGDGLMLLSSLSFAVGALISKNVCQKSDPTLVTGYQLAIGGAVLGIIGIVTGGSLPRVNSAGIVLLTYMALLSAVAFTLWTILIKYNSVSKISVYSFLTPVFGALLSALWLHEKLFQIKNLIALIFVCTGIYIVNAVKNTKKVKLS